jgi:hypothetical protein
MANLSLGMTGRALEIVAEDKLRAAIDQGEFDNLPCFGQPHPIFDEEYDPNWWIRRKLAREGLGGAACPFPRFGA